MENKKDCQEVQHWQLFGKVMKAKCGYCGKCFEIKTGHYNRAKSQGLNVYCSRKHSGFGRRLNKGKDQLQREKAFYDAFYRLFNEDRVKENKRKYFQKDYAANPEKYKAWRTKRMEDHKEYCRRPDYKMKKKKYDRTYRANKFYGPMAEPFLAYLDLRNELDNRISREQNNTFNKSQKRKRQWQKVQPKMAISSLLHP